MNRRLSRLLFLLLAMSAGGAISLVASCTDNTGTGLKPDGGAGGMTGGSGGGTGGSFFDGSAVSCDPTCSNDLKEIVDCYGVVKDTCPSDKGCYNAACDKDPCEAAELSKSSYGCDYWALKTALLDKAQGACFAAYVANTWTTPVKIEVEYDGQKLDPANFAYVPKGQGTGITYEPYDAVNGLGVGDVAILFLARNDFGFVIDCPKPAAITTEAGVTDTGMGKAFHITTDKPVVAYQILPYGGGPSAFTSATLLLPTSAWDTNYVAVNAYPAGTIDLEAEPFLSILAKEDATAVTILPKVNILGGGGIEAATKNEEKTYLLNKGEFLQIEQPEELTGSPIQSDKPVGVWGGHSCLFIPLNKNGCDSAQQQIPPVKALGNEYVGVSNRLRGNETKIPWRLVGAVDGTKLTWEVPEGSPVPAGVPEEIGLGTIVDFEHPGGFVVRSQGASNPFYLSAYMTGGELFNNEGDPDWVNMIPPAQFLDNYVLFADPTYPETNLVVVRTKSKIMTEGFKDVTLDCLGPGGTPAPIEGWKPLGGDPSDPESHIYEYTRVNLVTGNFENVGNCSNGRREMSSALPFGVTVWGWGSKAAQGTQLVSYAYPAGANVQPINKVDIPITPQ
jgi:hypothetical protein